MGNIGWEWWILYAEIAFVGFVVIFHLRDICESTEKANRQLGDICDNTEGTSQYLDYIQGNTEEANRHLFDIWENTGGRFSTDDPD